MPKEYFNPEIRDDSTPADAFESFLRSHDKQEDHLYKRLLKIWHTHGEEAARKFCINDADKFDITEEEVKFFLERTLFDAGEEGLDTKTPWNTHKRRQAGLPHLHSY